MRIRTMTATFGCLDGDILTPGEGLTVITAPNEGGKSTWCAFLQAMLYGIDTRERDRAGALAGKNRYQPWSGAPMSGQLELEWQGREITLRRYPTRSGPFQGFEAVYTASGDPVPGLTGANAGQTLLGVEREVFVRSAFLSQGSGPVTAAPELERRIAALATAGQEDASYLATQRTLRDWRNRRQSNRSTGLIPQLREQLSQVQAQLQAMERANALRDQAEEHLALLKEEEGQLQAELDLHRRLEGRQLHRRYAQVQAQLDQARAQRDCLPTPAIDLPPPPTRQQPFPRPAALTLGAAGLAALALGLALPSLAASLAGVLALLALAFLLLADRRGGPAPSPLSPDSQMAAHQSWLAQRERLDGEIRRLEQESQALQAQGAQPVDTLEFLQPPSRTPQQLRQRLAQVREELSRWQSQRDRAEGALHGDPLELEARQGQLQAQLEDRAQELDALELALAGLEQANGLLRERFSPILHRQAAQILSQITQGRYGQLVLHRDLSALVGGEGSLPRSALYLSAGAADQLYLALRLALSQLAAAEAPLVLDDALANFDDVRAHLALDYLAQLGRQRQILLFSCHSREARWAQSNGIPVRTLS